MNLPKYNITNTVERLGVNAVAMAIAEMGQIWRETPLADVGIDGQIEYVDTDGYATGRMIAVQIKSGNSFFKEKNGEWVFYPEGKHQFYWERFPLPVLIIIHNPESNLSYWVDARHALRTSSDSSKKAISIPKNSVLQKTEAKDLFAGFGVLDQSFMSVEGVLNHLITTKSKNASFPISYLDLFCTGLTNICRSIYFGMDIAMTIAEIKLEMANSAFGVGLGRIEQDFLFNYIKFLVHQHIADIDFSDCMIDWYDRKMQPTFMAPLTSRGRELVNRIQSLESEYVASGRIPETGYLHAAQEGLVRMNFTHYATERIELMDKIEKEFLRHSQKEA